MTAPAQIDIRRSTSSDTESLIRRVHEAAALHGHTLGANRVVKLVRQYQRDGGGLSLHDYVAWQAFGVNPDDYKTLDYRDPVGERAVANVMRSTTTDYN